MRLTATLSTHAATLAQLPPPDVPVLVGDAVGVVVVEEEATREEVAREEVAREEVAGEEVVGEEVVGEEEEPETGQVFPRTDVTHEEVASGNCRTNKSSQRAPT